MATAIAQSEPARSRDIIVIGCSAGGVEALPRILQQLTASLPATVFIAQHLAPSENPYLVELLRRSSRLPVQWAEQGEPFVRGKVYVAPPDVHLLFADHHMHLSRTARENHSRPSIDKLFRSAAATYGSRVIGVLLTGMLDDGVAGLRAIREAGGVVLVQDPEGAAYPDLPRRALDALDPDRTLPLDAIGGVLSTLVEQRTGAIQVPDSLTIEAEIDRIGSVQPDTMHRLGDQTTISCPECHGPMWALGDERTRRYRCYNGHASTAADMLVSSGTEVETALWSAVRALNDRASTLEALATDARRLDNVISSETYAERAREARAEAEVVREFMQSLTRR